MDNLTQDEQLMAIRIASVGLSASPAAPTAATSTPPTRSRSQEQLPGSAELSQLCPYISPPASTGPSASPFLTHAEKEMQRLKAQLEAANKELEDLRRAGAGTSSGSGSGDHGSHPAAAVKEDSGETEAQRIAGVRLQCEQEWADYFAEQSIEAEEQIKRLEAELQQARLSLNDSVVSPNPSLLLKPLTLLPELCFCCQVSTEQAAMYHAQVEELESRTAKVESLLAENAELRTGIETERTLRATALRDSTALR